MFSNWRYNIDGAARRQLEPSGWQGPDPDTHPTGADLVAKYLKPLGKSLTPWLHFGRQVVAVSREGIDKVKDVGREKAPFLIEMVSAEGQEPGFYIAGMKSYGRAPTFLLATGHEQVRSIAAALAGDLDAAARVELVLPETGVCSGPGPQAAQAAAQGCCGGPAKMRADACCVRDEVAKDSGASGCGCGSTSEASKVAACC